MSKGLKALNNLIQLLALNYTKMSVASKEYNDMKAEENLNIVVKELKAIDVIKDICKLKVYKNKLGQCFLEGTNILFPISQETYDLLKEVLL